MTAAAPTLAVPAPPPAAADAAQPAAAPVPPVIRRKPSLDISVTGLIYCSMMMFLGLAAISSQANLLFAVFGLMIGILVVSAFVSRSVLAGVTVRRSLPESAVAGRPVVIAYEFVNEKRLWPSLSIIFAELDDAERFTRQPQAYLMHVATKSTAHVPVEVVPRRRGLVTFDSFQLCTSFPFGFIKRAVDRNHRDTLLVYPPLATVDTSVLQLLRSSETSGPTVKPRRGGTDEFYGIKEFRRGENPRRIYWRRSARTGTLVSKEMTQVSPPKMVLLVDTYNPDPTNAAAVATVEHTIAMAASLADYGLENNLSVGLCAWSGDAWVSIPPNRGKRHHRDLLSALARLPANTARDAAALLQASTDMMRSGASPLLFTPSDRSPGLSNVRAGLVVFSPALPRADRYFKFPPGTNFFITDPPTGTVAAAPAAAAAAATNV